MHASARVPSAEAILAIRAGCALRCTFCSRSPDRVGHPLDDALSPSFDLPCARRVVLVAGDVLRPDLAPLVGRLRAGHAEEVVAYAHAGPVAPDAVRTLAASGLTGLLVVVPAADRATLADLTRGTGSTARLAALLDAAGDAGLGVELEVPVLAGTHAGLAETVRRAP
ncbi:MAG: radical SAM protein, partial [Deltaproteobacteria bacterium]|nr:radical SAM protein [Deltaproteobacteria bacterium]